MHRFVLVLSAIFLVTPAFLAQDNYRTSVLVLNNGSKITIKGDYELYGDEVQFVNLKDERMVLTRDKVDFRATEELNAELAKKAQGSEIEDDGTLYNKVKRWKKQQGSEMYDKSDMSTEEMAQQVNQDYPTDSGSQQQQLEDLQRQAQEQFGQIMKQSGFLFLGLLGLFALAALVSFITQIYLIIISFRESTGWGLTLLFGMAGPPIIQLLATLFAIENTMVALGLLGISLLASLIALFGFPIFILTNCHGSRLRLILFWGAPLFLVLIAIPILFFTGIVAGLSMTP